MRRRVTEGDVDALMQQLDDDLDLDALMARVREAALGTGTSSAISAPTPAPAPNDGQAREADLVSIIEAQGEWNAQTRKVIADLVQCLQTLRDDWADAHESLRIQMARRAAPRQRAGGSARAKQPRRLAKGKRRRS